MTLRETEKMYKLKIVILENIELKCKLNYFLFVQLSNNVLFIKLFKRLWLDLSFLTTFLSSNSD